MGEIVAAGITAHPVVCINRPPTEDSAQLDGTIAGMRELGALLDAAQPDAVVMIGPDHLETFFLDAYPTLAVFTGAWAVTPYHGVDYELRGQPELAAALVQGCTRRGFDVTTCQRGFLGHQLFVPAEFVFGRRPIPIVPVFVNCYVPPLPQPQRCYQFGRALAEVLLARPERIALVATGGMSHYPGTPRYAYPDRDFDRLVIDALERGAASSLLGLSAERLDAKGASELLAWYVLFGALGDRKARLLSYQPTWHHGHGVLAFPLAAPITALPPLKRLPQPAVRDDEQYTYYPPLRPEAYPLNRLLYDIRMDGAVCARFVADQEAVGREYGLDEAAAGALRSLEIARLVAAGGHPLMAFNVSNIVRARRGLEPDWAADYRLVTQGS